MAMPIAGFLVAVMMVTAMALASMAGTGLAQAQTDRDILNQSQGEMRRAMR